MEEQQGRAFARRISLSLAFGEPGFVRADAKAVRRILAHRHERVDGTGTPHGLVGDEIDVGARILAVAGAFEGALDHGPNASRNKANARIEELRSRAGREFDPMVVEALVLVGVEEGWLDRGWALGSSEAADAA